VFVFENGVMQFPTTDYTITGTNLSFVTAPATNVAIQIRELSNGGSANSLSGLTDVDVTSAVLGQVLGYTGSNWMPTAGGGATTGTTSTFVIANNTTSTNTITGALVVTGGVGIGGDINLGGSLYQNGVLLGGGGGADSYVKTYFWEGALQENISTKRYYIHVASTLESIGINLGAAGQTQSTIQIKKNNTALNTIVIAANTTYQVETVSHALAVNDFLTVDITQSSSAANLYVTFVYRE
jgi:hypothetical protein